MKAIRISAPIGIEGLVYEDAPDPEPAIGDVLVKVHACGFTASELYWPLYTDRAGRDRTPIIPGHEFSGVVVGLGRGTAGIADGDEVYGLIDGYRNGAAAELIAIEARDVAPAPTTVDNVHAAALPQAGLTSWQALFDHGGLTAGQTVVIHGAAGAVGSMAVQLAKVNDVRVIGTGRASASALAVELGAEQFVALDHDGWADEVDEVDVVFDTIGGDVLARSAKIVKPGGALVSVVAPPPTDRDDIRTVFFIRDPNRAQLVEIARLVDAGKVRPQVGAVYPLAEARGVHGEVERWHSGPGRPRALTITTTVRHPTKTRSYVAGHRPRRRGIAIASRGAGRLCLSPAAAAGGSHGRWGRPLRAASDSVICVAAQLRKHGEGPGDVEFDVAAGVLKLLADPTRLKIVWALLHGEHSVNELADHVGARPPAVSQHLAKLRAADLVRSRRDGNRIIYAARNEHIEHLATEALLQADHLVTGGRHHQTDTKTA